MVICSSIRFKGFMDLINGNCREINTEIVFTALLPAPVGVVLLPLPREMKFLILEISKFLTIFQRDLKFRDESMFGKTA